jgi:hypothetical protein
LARDVLDDAAAAATARIANDDSADIDGMMPQKVTP